MSLHDTRNEEWFLRLESLRKDLELGPRFGIIGLRHILLDVEKKVPNGLKELKKILKKATRRRFHVSIPGLNYNKEWKRLKAVAKEAFVWIDNHESDLRDSMDQHIRDAKKLENAIVVKALDLKQKADMSVNIDQKDADELFNMVNTLLDDAQENESDTRRTIIWDAHNYAHKVRTNLNHPENIHDLDMIIRTIPYHMNR